MIHAPDGEVTRIECDEDGADIRERVKKNMARVKSVIFLIKRYPRRRKRKESTRPLSATILLKTIMGSFLAMTCRGCITRYKKLVI